MPLLALSFGHWKNYFLQWKKKKITCLMWGKQASSNSGASRPTGVISCNVAMLCFFFFFNMLIPQREN